MNDALSPLRLPAPERPAGLRAAPQMRVFGIGAVVAEHEVAAFGETVGSRPVRARRHVRERRAHRLAVDVDRVVLDLQLVVRLLRDVRLVHRDAVAVDDAVVDAQLVAGKPDRPFDEVVRAHHRRGEDDDVAFVRLPEAVFELVDEQDVVHLQRRLHRPARNVERADDERDQEQRDEPGDDERVEILAQHLARRRRGRARGGAGRVLAESDVAAIAGNHRLFADADRDADDREERDQPEQLERGHAATLPCSAPPCGRPCAP